MGRHSLYRNNGDETFTDVTQKAGIAAANTSYGMTVIAADFDEDGWPDIYVASDSTPSLLYMNNHDGTFREEGVQRGVALSDDGAEQAGMGVGVGDYDLDGHIDIFKTHFADDANGLYHNDGKGNFDDATRTGRVGVETRYICWGAAMVDLDNDGYPDLFLTAGNVYPEVERKLPQYANKNPRAVFRNLGAVLAAGGSSFADVVKVTVFLTDVDDRPLINPVRQEAFGPARPASTLVEISRLAVTGAKIEVEAIAILNDPLLRSEPA